LRLASNDPAQLLLPHIAPLLAPLGFKPFWFSNDWVQAFASRNTGLIATQFAGGVLAIDLAADEPEALGQIRQILTQNIKLPHVFPVRGKGKT